VVFLSFNRTRIRFSLSLPLSLVVLLRPLRLDDLQRISRKRI